MLEKPQVAEERGYVVEDDNNTVRIGIPYNAEGGYRKVSATAVVDCVNSFRAWSSDVDLRCISAELGIG